MKIKGFTRMLLVAGLLGLTGCGGGGGSSTPAPTPAAPPAKATTTISGTVQSTSSGVSKRVAGAGTAIYVQAYTLDGTAVGSQVTADATTGAYTIPDLPPGVDYVIKSTNGLKKLIEKLDVAPGATVTGQNVSDVSTTAVVIASQKLAAAASVPNLSLGDPTTLTDQQKSTMSSAIFTQVAPQTLEQTISDTAAKVQQAIQAQSAGSNAAPPDLSGLNADLVNIVNMLNIVVAAVTNNTSINTVLSGQSNLQIKPLSLSGSSLTEAAATTVSTTVVSQVQVSTAAYTPPPRVALNISTDVPADSLSGITFDVTVPAGAKVAVGALCNGQTDVYWADMSKISMASGVFTGAYIQATYNSTTRKLRVTIAAGANSSLPTGNLANIVFDTVGTDLSFSESVVTTSDKTGNSLSTSFTLSGTSS